MDTGMTTEPDAQTPVPQTPDRQKQLDAMVAERVAGGSRVESNVGTVAVLVRGKNINHVLHVILTIFTLTLWFWCVYFWMLCLNGWVLGEKRTTLRIDANDRIIQSNRRLFGIWKSEKDVTPL